MRLDYAVPGKAEPGVDAEGRLELFAPMGALFRADGMEATPRGFPAFYARRFGAGRVVYFPTDITRAYFMKNSPATHALLARAVRWAAGEAPPVEIDGNLHVEATGFVKGKLLYVHLLNDLGGWGRASPTNPETFGYRKDIVPLVDLPVWLNADVRRVRLLPGGAELPVRRVGDRRQVIVPRLELHAVLALEPN
jgi:hypothetical protein